MGYFIKGGSLKDKNKIGEDLETGFVKWLFEISKLDVFIAGGKGACLSDLYTSKFPVPPAFIISTQAFGRFTAAIFSQIQRIVEETNVEDLLQLNENSKKIREMIEKSEFFDDMQKEILEAYDLLGTDKHDPHISANALGILRVAKEPVFVAVRSSATTEDLACASFAGQQETYLNIKGNSRLLWAVKKCFSSLYTPRAIYYRNKQGFKDSQPLLAVIVQKMVNSDKSGVMFSKNPIQDDGNIVIEAVYGLGEGIVSGEIQPDSYKVNKDLDILDKRIGDKKKAIVRSGAGECQEVGLIEERRAQQVLTDGQIKEIADLGLRIEKHYGKPQDIEFAIEDGKVFIVQSRPITMLGKKMEPHPINGKVLLTGIPASPGLVHGKVTRIKGIGDINKIKKGDILVTETFNPDMIVAMHLAEGIVSDEGGATSHAAIIAREMRIPCIVSAKEATLLLKDGETVTVDGSTGKVYEGNLGKEKEEHILPIKNINTKTKIKIFLDSPNDAKKASESKCRAVGLVKLDGIIKESGKHPLNFLADKKMEEYTLIISNGIEKISEYFDSVWIQDLDIKTDELKGLQGSPKITEANPLLGMHGIRFALKNREVLNAELDAIRKVAEKNPIKKFGIMFSKITSLQEVVLTRKEFSKIRTENMEFGVIIDTPAAVQIIDELCHENLDFVSIGISDLTQYTLAADKNNTDIKNIYDEQHIAVLRQIEKVIKTCKNDGIKISIHGSSTSKPEMVKFLLDKGIDSITVDAKEVMTTAELVQEIESKLDEERIKSSVERITQEVDETQKMQPAATKEIETMPEIATPADKGYLQGIGSTDSPIESKNEEEHTKDIEEDKEEEGIDVFEGIKPDKSIGENEGSFVFSEGLKYPKNSLLDLINTDFLCTPEFNNIQKAIERKVEQIQLGNLETQLVINEEKQEEKELLKIEQTIEKVEKELMNLPFLESKMPEKEVLTITVPDTVGIEIGEIHLQESSEGHQILDIF